MVTPITLYLIGFPGTGKYTIAKALVKYGYKIVDNHLINNPILSLLELNENAVIPDFIWDLIREIRASVFRFISHDKFSSYVFTNVLYDTEND